MPRATRPDPGELWCCAHSTFGCEQFALPIGGAIHHEFTGTPPYCHSSDRSLLSPRFPTRRAMNHESSRIVGYLTDADSDLSVPATIYDSGRVANEAVIAPRDVVEGLPEWLVDWLHTSVDCRASLRRFPLATAMLARFEDAVVERLFPRRDCRKVVELLRAHVLVTAIAADVVAEAAGLPRETARICGLLHDVGFASVLRHADDARLLRDPRAFGQLLPTLLRASMRHSAHMVLRWCLPSRIRFAIRDHVTYSRHTAPAPIASSTVIAEHLADVLGYGMGFEHHAQPRVRGVTDALLRLGLSDRWLEDLKRSVIDRLDGPLARQRSEHDARVT